MELGAAEINEVVGSAGREGGVFVRVGDEVGLTVGETVGEAVGEGVGVGLLVIAGIPAPE